MEENPTKAIESGKTIFYGLASVSLIVACAHVVMSVLFKVTDIGGFQFENYPFGQILFNFFFLGLLIYGIIEGKKYGTKVLVGYFFLNLLMTLNMITKSTPQIEIIMLSVATATIGLLSFFVLMNSNVKAFCRYQKEKNNEGGKA